jgi:hypothetical protein
MMLGSKVGTALGMALGSRVGTADAADDML